MVGKLQSQAPAKVKACIRINTSAASMKKRRAPSSSMPLGVFLSGLRGDFAAGLDKYS
jgi:hypothetical protein